jgi:exonuclease III
VEKREKKRKKWCGGGASACGDKLSLLLFVFVLYSPLYTARIYTGTNTVNMNNLNDKQRLSISIINCNSLNMSNSAKWNQTLKICGITKLKSDIILLSDIRISNKNLISAEQDLKNMFLHNPYERYNCFFNSTKNKRGVAILIKYELQYEVLSEIAATDENSLLLHLNIQGNNLCVISLYGPNNTDPDFFTALEEWVRQYTNQQVPVIIGGDFNCTYSSDPVPDNIDCFNMTRPPNITHSRKINEICDQYNLVDPYRLMNPDLQEFTYSPRSIAMKNQSRLDFFLVSETILDSVSSCKINFLTIKQLPSF